MKNWIIIGFVLLTKIPVFGQKITLKMPPPSIPDSLLRLNRSWQFFQPNSALVQRPLAFRQAELPFFCRLEHQFNAQNKIPFYFRLGSLDYVNELEKKQIPKR